MKKVTLLFALFLPLLLASCQKEDTAWFLDNGWTEGILDCGNTYKGIGMQIDANGNINGFYETNGYYYDHGMQQFSFRLYSSMDQLEELTNAPSDGYVGTFLCEGTNCGISRGYHHTWSNHPTFPSSRSWYTYYKFYMRRINSCQYKIYAKEWYTEELN